MMGRVISVAVGIAGLIVIAALACSGGGSGERRTTTDPDLGRTHVRTDLPGAIDASMGEPAGSGSGSGTGSGSGSGSGPK